MWTELIEQIVAILKANILLGDEVYNYEVEEFGGDPAATVTPSTNISEFNTTEENIRIYAFTIRLFVTRTLAPTGKDAKSDADRKLRNLVDSVLDDIDANYLLPNLDAPAGYTFINLFAVPSSWGYAGDRGDEFRAAEIAIRARVSVDISAVL